MSSLQLSTRALSVALTISDEPPTEFQIFAPGVNSSTKGPSLFDRRAAESVMAEYRKHGVDLMIDLEHAAYEAPHARPDCTDARGWFQLELRSDGSLWAVNVRWTPDGERRLREKTQRYISPLFAYDKKSGRIARLLNVALCAMPATDHIAPLVAASDRDSKRLAAIRMLALACSMLPRQTSVSLQKAHRSTRISNGSRTHQKGARSTRIR